MRNETGKEKEVSGTKAPVDKTKSPDNEKVHCKCCNKEFESEDEYIVHVYDNEKCYSKYVSLEKKEMSKQ